MNKLDLTSLLERVRDAAGPSAVLDAELYATIGGAPHTATAGHRKVPLVLKDDPKDWPAYTASIDAALALVERVLPGWEWLKKSPKVITLYRPLTEQEDTAKAWAKHIDGTGATIPLAILSALLRALTSNQEGNDEA